MKYISVNILFYTSFQKYSCSILQLYLTEGKYSLSILSVYLKYIDPVFILVRAHIQENHKSWVYGMVPNFCVLHLLLLKNSSKIHDI